MDDEAMFRSIFPNYVSWKKSDSWRRRNFGFKRQSLIFQFGPLIIEGSMKKKNHNGFMSSFEQKNVQLDLGSGSFRYSKIGANRVKEILFRVSVTDFRM